MRQGVSSHGIDLVNLEHSGFSTRMVNQIAYHSTSFSSLYLTALKCWRFYNQHRLWIMVAHSSTEVNCKLLKTNTKREMYTQCPYTYGFIGVVFGHKYVRSIAYYLHVVTDNSYGLKCCGVGGIAQLTWWAWVGQVQITAGRQVTNTC